VSKEPTVGPWAKEKLDALARYLDFYTKVLKGERWRLLYVDAFAGGGRAAIRAPDNTPPAPSLWEAEEADADQQEFVDGSPRIAMALANPFDRYVFIDANAARVSELEALAREYGSARTVSIRPGYSDDEIAWVLSQSLSKGTHRGVAFLDPFGAHLSWKTIEALAATKLFEVIINFPLDMAINRLMKVDGDIPPSWRAQLDGVFGESDWFLFAMGPRKRPDAKERLLKLYREKLKTAFGHVSQPKLIRNTKNSPLYYLLWAGPHRKGLEGADYILGMGERLPTGPRGGKPVRDK
jgi:three-Cys-motif partner protein